MKVSHIQRIPPKQVYNMRPDELRLMNSNACNKKSAIINESQCPQHKQQVRKSSQIMSVSVSPSTNNRSEKNQQSYPSLNQNNNVSNMSYVTRFQNFGNNCSNLTHVAGSNLTKANVIPLQRQDLASGLVLNSRICQSSRGSSPKSSTPVKINYQNPNPSNYYNPTVTYVTTSSDPRVFPSYNLQYIHPNGGLVQNQLRSQYCGRINTNNGDRNYLPKQMTVTHACQRTEYQYFPIQNVYIRKQQNDPAYMVGPAKSRENVALTKENDRHEIQSQYPQKIYRQKFICNCSRSPNIQHGPFCYNSQYTSQQASSQTLTSFPKSMTNFSHLSQGSRQNHSKNQFENNDFNRYRTEGSQTERYNRSNSRKRVNIFELGKNRNKEPTYISENETPHQFAYTINMIKNKEQNQQSSKFSANRKMHESQRSHTYLSPESLKNDKIQENKIEQNTRRGFRQRVGQSKIVELLYHVKNKIRHSPQEQQSEVSDSAPKSKCSAKKQNSHKSTQRPENDSEYQLQKSEEKQKLRWRDKISKQYIKDKVSRMRGKNGKMEEQNENQEKQTRHWRDRFSAHNIKQKLSKLRRGNKQDENSAENNEQQQQENGQNENEGKVKRSWKERLTNSRLGKVFSRSKSKGKINKQNKQDDDLEHQEESVSNDSKSKGKWRQRLSRKNIKQKLSRLRKKDGKQEAEQKKEKGKHQGITGYLSMGISGLTTGIEAVKSMVLPEEKSKQQEKDKSKGSRKHENQNGKKNKKEKLDKNEQKNEKGYSYIEIAVVLTLIVTGVAMVFYQIYR